LIGIDRKITMKLSIPQKPSKLNRKSLFIQL